MNFKECAEILGEKLKNNIPQKWNGKDAILEMKNNSFPQWKQMEWIGFYFEFLCRNNLSDIMNIPGPKYGNVSFDGFKEIPWDFKAHAANTSSHQIIINDSEAIESAIKQYKMVGVIIAIGDVLYNDKDRTFQKWHEDLKGGKSKYEIERIKRGAWSRLRKVSFDLKQISFLKITEKTLIKSGSFQKDFRNADGSKRSSKLLINLEKVDEELEYFINFNDFK